MIFNKETGEVTFPNQVYNRYNAPKGKAVQAGDEIYEWEYFDEAGKICKDKKNVKEEINSFLPLVDYKKMIARGELELNGSHNSDSIKDFRNLPDSKVDFIKFVNYVAALPEGQVSKYLQSIMGEHEKDLQTKQTTSPSTIKDGQVSSEDTKNQSTRS